MAALKGVKTLDMKNGEITKVSYEGSEYERVEGDAKVGDLVTSTYLTESGEFFVCYDVDCDSDAVFADGLALERSMYELFRKKHTRLKVGDYAKVVDWPGRFKGVEGDLVKILIDDRKYRPFHCELLSGNYVGQKIWACESELVPATKDEVASAKEAEAKRSIEAKRAKIGRKVNEYKVGDIVSYDDPQWFENKGIGEVTEATDEDDYTGVVATDNGGRRIKYYLLPKKLKLITPVEARFDRS
ncbi:hypothetical protein [Bacillus safensis]|uniref:hypothetical protein n=1 Tax=Bacillus safensis TaxID=561879 RepID=UPI000407803B|nr:hypothetical protein [Bacillus safensis]